jgi:NAD(P)-dependent dehydrogenase (short-subunit alcohol dehydrogenase family)
MGETTNRADLDGQVALVTGGANGIGAAVAERLAGRGARLVLVDVDDDAGRALADRLGATYVHGDVREPADSEDAVAAALEAHGRLDLVHLNAGVATGCGMDENFDLATYRRAMAINLDGVVFGVNAAVPALRSTGGGTIVLTASMAGIVPVAIDPLYAANKHAVVGLGRSLAELYRAEGIRVQVLCPSFADTAILGEGRALLEEAGFPILEVAAVVDTFESLVDSGGTGECWFVVPGRESEPFAFRRAPGPRD